MPTLTRMILQQIAYPALILACASGSNDTRPALDSGAVLRSCAR